MMSHPITVEQTANVEPTVGAKENPEVHRFRSTPGPWFLR